jgi:Uma2 family endonuclease
MVISDWNLTLDQFLDLPEATPALEYDPPCNGQGARVRQKMSPSEAHSALQAAFAYLLRPLRDRGLRIRTELRIVRGQARVPDVSVYALADLAPTALLRGRYPTTPPQIAIEIRSPDEDLKAQVDRCRLYVDEWGCPLALLVDPESAEAEVFAFRPQQSPSVYRAHERIEPLYEGFGLELTPRTVWTEADLER